MCKSCYSYNTNVYEYDQLINEINKGELNINSLDERLKMNVMRYSFFKANEQE